MTEMEWMDMRKVLVVVDMQKDFIDGALGTKEAQAIVPAVVEKIKSYPIEDVYATMDTHGADYLNTAEGRRLPVVHCVKGTPGWELGDEIKAAVSGAKIIEKPTFGSIKLMELLTKENEKETLEIELIGLCTDICVVSNALLLKAAMPENVIKADERCCAGVTVRSHKEAVGTMKMCQIDVYP